MNSFILASASPRRLELLRQIGMVPAQVVAASIDETPRKSEKPKDHALRLAEEKAVQIAARHKGSVVLAADTVVALGRRILPQANDAATARHCLQKLSGRRHRVITALCVIDKTGKPYMRAVESVVMFARLSAADIEQYVKSGEWKGKAGGYAIQGAAAMFISWMRGSYSAVVGLPLYETRLLLRQAGVIS